MKMSRFSLGLMRMDRMRKGYIRGMTHDRGFGSKNCEAFSEEKQTMNWRMLKMELPGSSSKKTKEEMK